MLLTEELSAISRQNSNSLRLENYVDYLDIEDNADRSRDPFLNDFGTEASGMPMQTIYDVDEDVEKELEYSYLQEKLDERLEQKEAEMEHYADTDTSLLKQQYEKKVNSLELENRGLRKLKKEGLQKLNALETQVAELRKELNADEIFPDEDADASTKLEQCQLPAGRKRVLWSDKEIKTLKDGVVIYSEPNKNIPWKKILEYGQGIFDKTRTSANLKDKWRKMAL